MNRLVTLYSTRTLFCCLVLLIGAGCKAQNSPDNPKINRRIELLVRSQFQVPPDYTVTLGTRGKSDIEGYDSLPVTFLPPGRPDKQSTVMFLVSRDGNTLARLEKFDLTKDPRDDIATAFRPIRGSEAAKVTIVNFDDLECPYCARMHKELFPATLDHYKGLIKVVYKDDPLVELHPWALHAAVDTNCLAEQSPEAIGPTWIMFTIMARTSPGPTRTPAKLMPPSTGSPAKKEHATTSTR